MDLKFNSDQNPLAIYRESIFTSSILVFCPTYFDIAIVYLFVLKQQIILHFNVYSYVKYKY